MFKKIALCAMLVLILAPASVMAAVQTGQAQGIGNEAGNCLNVQHQITIDTMAQEKSQNGQGQGAGSSLQNGDARMLQTRSGDQAGEQDRSMAKNMTRDQVRLNADSIQKQNGSADSVQNRSGPAMGNGQSILTNFADQLGAQVRNIEGMFHTLGQ